MLEPVVAEVTQTQRVVQTETQALSHPSLLRVVVAEEPPQTRIRLFVLDWMGDLEEEVLVRTELTREVLAIRHLSRPHREAVVGIQYQPTLGDPEAEVLVK